MPILWKKNISPDCILAIWQIWESDEELLSMLGSNYFQPDHHQRIKGANARHYLSSRLLLTQIFPHHQIVLSKNNNNKPSLEIDGIFHPVSITHSHDYAGILVSGESDLGIDMEKIDKRIARVKKKFMNDAELNYAGKEEQINEQTLIWSAKETLYKLYSKKEVDFRENLFILPFEMLAAGMLHGKIQLGHFEREVIINYEVFDNYVLTYTQQLIHHDA